MAGRKLAATVHVDGTIYPAGASVPAEVAELITNPKAWGDDHTPSDSDEGTAPAAPKVKGKAKASKAPMSTPADPPAVDPNEAGADDELVAPPRVGAGSGTEAWRTYALAAAEKAGVNIEIPEGTKRDDIVAALEEAGLITKPKE